MNPVSLQPEPQRQLEVTGLGASIYQAMGNEAWSETRGRRVSRPDLPGDRQRDRDAWHTCEEGHCPTAGPGRGDEDT